MLTAEFVRGLLNYDPETGIFTWKVRAANCIQIGDISGYRCSSGHIVIRIKRRGYFAHRLAFLYMTGAMPENVVDHRDTDPGNNRWLNLRHATTAQNAQNSGVWKTSTTGFKGVCFNKRIGKYQVQVRANGKRRYLGLYTTAEEAHAAYCEAAGKLHGEFFNGG